MTNLSFPPSSQTTSPENYYDYEAQRMFALANGPTPHPLPRTFNPPQMHPFTPIYHSSTISPQGSINLPNPIAVNQEDQSMHSSVTSFNTGTNVRENATYMELQNQINIMKHDKERFETNNRLLLQQVLEGQKQIQNIYSQMSSLTHLNHTLAQQLQAAKNENSNPTNPPPDSSSQSIPVAPPSVVQETSTQQTTQFPSTTINQSTSLNQALLDMLQAQKGYFENKVDTTSLLTKFPAFTGKSSTEFRTWYDKILSILATPPWTSVFQDVNEKLLHTDDMISSDLSSKLYSKLRTSLTGNAEKVMMSKPEVWGKGLLYLATLKVTYQEKLQRGDILRKREEFSAMMQTSKETIDDFGARCIFLRKQLVDHGLVISLSELKDTFIMGLGPLFTRIQQSQESELPPQWQTTEIQLLINAAKSFKASVEAVRERNKKFTQIQKSKDVGEDVEDTKPEPTNGNEKQARVKKDQERQSKIKQDIIEGIFSPRTYFNAVKPNCCIWHNSDSHTHLQCNEIGRLLRQHPNQRYYNTNRHSSYQNNLNSNGNAMNNTAWNPRPSYGSNQPNWRRSNYNHQPPLDQHNQMAPRTNSITQQQQRQQFTGPPTQNQVRFQNQNQPQQLHTPSARHTSIDPEQDQTVTNTHAQQLQVSELDLQDLQDATNALNNLDNNSNENVSHYILNCKNVKLQNSLPPISSYTKTNQPHFIIDSAAFPHMCNDSQMFTNLRPWTDSPSHVRLADNSTKTPIKGIGDITIRLGSHTTTLKDVLHVPGLSDSLFSAKLHSQEQGHYVHIENDITTVAFQNFTHTFRNGTEIRMHYKKSPPCANRVSTTSTKPHPTPLLPKSHKIKPFNPLVQVPFKRMSPQARKPTRSTDGAAGLDIFSSQHTVIAPGSRMKIHTDIQLEIPIGYYGRIAPRSGLSMNSNIDVAGGVIDCDYRGEIFPCLINNGSKPFTINKHDRIAQLIFEQIGQMELTEVEDLLHSVRGRKGFGSTESNPQCTAIKDIPSPPINTNTSRIISTPGPHKITIQFPWSQTFNKVIIKTHTNGFEISDNNNISHILPKATILSLINTNKLQLGHKHLISKPNHQISPESKTYPPTRLVDKPITNAPHQSIFSIDQLRKGFGFRGVQNIIKELQETSTNFRISTTDRENIIDLGEIATIDAPKRNNNTTTLPQSLGDVVHMDIIFGSNTAIGGTKYALFLVDKATRNKFIYPLINTKHEQIIQALQQFTKDIATNPKILRTDFDYKLMGSKVVQYLSNSSTQLEAAPPEQQNQNGLCERNWRSVLRMARSWLANSLLPSTFWWHALKRATEVANYIPLRIDGKLSTPHELAYGKKVDLRNIIPLFSVSYIRHNNESNSINSNSYRAILIGRSTKSHTYDFYHPPTKKIITTSIYRIDETIPAGPTFNLQYDGGMYFNKYHENHQINKSPTYTTDETAYIVQNNHVLDVKIIAIPITNDDIYTVQFRDGAVHQIEEKYLQKSNPLHLPHLNNQTTSTLPKWLKQGCRTTIFLNTMSEPCQGKLYKDSSWKFIPNNRIKHSTIFLPHLERDVLKLLNTFQIFAGNIPAWKVWQTKSSFNMGTIFARHVSAAGLTSTDVPSLIQHSKLNEKDRSIWDAAYSEEYYGLKNLPTWKTITESDYQRNKSKFGAILPTMAISTIKHDENGKPKRAKYRIVALGNLDPHQWRKEDCYAPVMSLMELRFLTALAVRQNRFLKSGDFKQAFCQAVLPQNETYVLRPPHGCPLTPKGAYWHLQRTLYGLKRSPRHWYEKAVELFAKIGLKQCPNAPCLFKGTPIKNKPPIYLGLYVDDFVYFSTNKDVENKFEKELQKLTNVDFMGQVSHFLGIKYQWRQTDKRTKVHMSQEAFSESLISQNGLSHISTKVNMTPYKSGFPVDSIQPDPNIDKTKQQELETKYRSMVGSLLWLSQGTRPDLATITNMLAKYQNRPTPKHIESAKYAIKYVKGSKALGITFDTNTDLNLASFVHFPIKTQNLTGISDANWGPQDQSVPVPNKKNPDLELFKSRSLSGHLITLHGPIHWSSKRQRITARSSCEAEIYATDECVKDIIHLRHIIKDLNLHNDLLKTKVQLFNDNMACVQWSKNLTTKGLRHLQIRENAIRESKKWLDVKHVQGKINPADIFSKEDKDPAHFIQMRNTIVHSPFTDDNFVYTAKLCINNNVEMPLHSKPLNI